MPVLSPMLSVSRCSLFKIHVIFMKPWKLYRNPGDMSSHPPKDLTRRGITKKVLSIPIVHDAVTVVLIVQSRLVRCHLAGTSTAGGMVQAFRLRLFAELLPPSASLYRWPRLLVVIVSLSTVFAGVVASLLATDSTLPPPSSSA